MRIDNQCEPIPGYRLLERIGCGGFGEVWKAEAPGGLLKAIKFVYGDLHCVDNSGGAKAIQELKALERIRSVRHPYILSLERCDIVDGQLVIVMELADRSLWDRFRECRNQGLPGIPRAELLGYLHEAAEALDFMNEKFHLQHLDIKPQNLFLVFNHVKVADFGLVKVVEGSQASVTGGVTPVYAAPETLLDGQVTRYTDQYSLAIVYQEMLTGQRPFTGTNTRQLIMQRMQGGPNLTSLPMSDQPIVGRALAREPAERFPSCLDFIRALMEVGASARPAVPLDETPGPSGLTPLLPRRESSLLQPGPLPATDRVAPKLYTPSVGELSRDATPEEDGAASAEAAAEPVSTRPEKIGDGLLRPALVVGLGGFGLSALRAFRKRLHQEFPRAGSLAVRLLGLDLEGQEGSPRGLSPEEVLPLRLQRPASYLKPRPGLPPIDDWITQALLYRIPKAGGSPGLRILGRLALIEQVRSLTSRLHRDLARITQEEALEKASAETGLALASNWPRVYVVSHLGGATGSGMLFDVAYLLRAQLQVLGFPHADLVGMLLLPPQGDPEWTDLALANSYASLLELRHFQRPGQGYFARLEDRDKVLADSRPPFTSVYLLPTPGPEATSRTQASRVVADFLYRHLFTALAKHRRNRSSQRTSAMPVRTFGLHVKTAPRRPLVRETARQVCRTLLTHWASKPTGNLAALVQPEVRERVQRVRLEPQQLLEVFQEACTRELGEPVPVILARWVEPLRATLPGGYPDPRLVREALQQAESLLGTPEDFHSLRPSPVTLIVRAAADHVLKQEGDLLLKQLLTCLDRPGFRVAGAEEAVQQTALMVEGWLKHFEQEVEQATAKMSGLLDRLLAEVAEWERLLKARSRAKRPPLYPPAEVVATAATLRYQQILHHGLTTVYLSLRGRLSDQMKDLRFCRTRLLDIKKLFEEESHSGDDPLPPHADLLLPVGVQNLRDWAASLSQMLTADQLARLDQKIQAALHKQFQPLAQLCLLPGDWPRRLQHLMLQETEELLEQIVPPHDAAELLLARAGSQEALASELAQAYDDAEPALAPPSPRDAGELALLVVPESEAGQTVAAQAESAWPQVQVVPDSHAQEIVLYRELDDLPAESLNHLGEEGKAAYELACRLENFTPHSRLDLDWERDGRD
jgi:serine/threonine protein kinase